MSLKDISQFKKSEWQFDWTKEIKDKTKEVYKLTTINNPSIIQGLISIEDMKDHIFMHLVENSKFNKGKIKFIRVSLETLLLMPVKFQLTKVIRDILPLMQRLL